MASVIKAGNATNGIQITSDSTGILEIKTGTGAGTTAITVGTDQAVTFAAGTTVSSLTTSGAVSAGSLTVNSNNISAVNSLGFRNRIINGDMRIDQRNAGASVTPADNAYTLDRWQSRLSQASKYSVQQSSTAPSGFNNSLLVTSLSAYTVGASEFFQVRQIIEGFNIADLGFGTASAKTITLSFWVRSSLTGTFGGVLSNSDGSRVYVFSYSISVADTWEQKTVTITGDTTGTWGTTTGGGFVVAWSLGAGASVSGSAGSWGSTLFRGVTSGTSVVGTNGATFYITGVQLEAGSVATPFERRDYGRELMMCQRYYCQYGDGAKAYQHVGNGIWYSSGLGRVHVQYPVPMRTQPSISYSALSDFNLLPGGVPTSISLNTDVATNISVGLNVEIASSTAGTSYQMLGNNSTAMRLRFSAEL